jgi:hypothetical protein
MIELRRQNISSRALCLSSLLVLTCGMTFSPSSRPLVETSTSLGSFLVIGELRGNIEPCGCSPLTDLGGLERIGVAIERYRSILPKLAIMSMGNNLPLSLQAVDKARVIERALQKIQPVVTLLGKAELKWLVAHPHDFAQDRPYILTNSRKLGLHNKVDVKRALIDRANGVIVFGIDSTIGHEFIRPVDESLRQEVAELANSTKAQKKILLFRGSDKELKIVAAWQFFDEIISGDPEGYHKDDKVLARRVPASHLMRPTKEQVSLSIPSGGQAVLKGGKLRLRQDLSLNLSAEKRHAPASIFMADSQLLIWLDPKFNGSSFLDQTLAQYDNAQLSKFRHIEEKYASAVKTSLFVGSKACQACHGEAYDAWSQSRHAHAYQTLRDKKKEQQPQCVSCHVVEYGAKGGFLSKKLTPHLSNVQCENCHGPRKEHAGNPAIRPKAQAKLVCETCHQGEHSPEFDYDKYWSKIKHGYNRGRPKAK